MNICKSIFLCLLICFASVDQVEAHYQRIGIRSGTKCTIPAKSQTAKFDAYCLDHDFASPKSYVEYSQISNPDAIKVQIGDGEPLSLAEAHRQGLIKWTISYYGGVNFQFERGLNAGERAISVAASEEAWFDTPENTLPHNCRQFSSDKTGPYSQPDLSRLDVSLEDVDKYYEDVAAILGAQASLPSATNERIQKYIWNDVPYMHEVQQQLAERGFYHTKDERDITGTKLALRAFNNSIGIDENRPFDPDIFKVTKYLSRNEQNKKYLYVRRKYRTIIVGYDKLYEIQIEGKDESREILTAISNIVKEEHKRIILIDESEDYWFDKIDINPLATGLSERFPQKNFYVASVADPDFRIYDATVTDNNIEMYHYKPVLRALGPSPQRLQQYSNNGLRVVNVINPSSMPSDNRRIIITWGDNDYSGLYYQYLEKLDGRLKDKIVISVACYRPGDNDFYYRLKREHGLNHIVRFSAPLDATVADLFILKISKHLHDDALNRRTVKEMLDKVIDELITENPGKPKYQELRKYIICFKSENRSKQNKFYCYEHTKTIFYC